MVHRDTVTVYAFWMHMHACGSSNWKHVFKMLLSRLYDILCFHVHVSLEESTCCEDECACM